MKSKKYLVTGGTGFIGSALVKRLVQDGHSVRVLDNNQRGVASRLADVTADIELFQADIRDAQAVQNACRGIDAVCHLAYVNGTEFFYTKPELVLEIGVKGMMNVIDGCMQEGVGELVLASSSEVYQTPPTLPTDETVPLSVPDPLNPRYSYGGGKIISELLAINYGRNHFERVTVFRPHNVFGPDMGWEHVIPQFSLRMKKICAQNQCGPVPFPVQGSGQETRSFIFIEDFLDGLMLMMERGEHLGIYHIGTMEEVTMAHVASLVAAYYGRDIDIVPGKPAEGATLRRCPETAKLQRLGFSPKITLAQGIHATVQWYDEHSNLCPHTY